jgi:hypothetical protein
VVDVDPLLHDIVELLKERRHLHIPSHQRRFVRLQGRSTGFIISTVAGATQCGSQSVGGIDVARRNERHGAGGEELLAHEALATMWQGRGGGGRLDIVPVKQLLLYTACPPFHARIKGAARLPYRKI